MSTLLSFGERENLPQFKILFYPNLQLYILEQFQISPLLSFTIKTYTRSSSNLEMDSWLQGI